MQIVRSVCGCIVWDMEPDQNLSESIAAHANKFRISTVYGVFRGKIISDGRFLHQGHVDYESEKLVYFVCR
jgi:hypothetical protein